MKRLLSTLSLIALAQPVLAQTVLDSDFTISVPTASGQPLVESTTLVPLLTDTCYYWHLHIAKTKSAVEVSEVYTLPVAPKDWELGEGSLTVISNAGRTATTPLTLTPDAGWIASGWCVSEGDPAGDYIIEIKAGDELLHRFEFELADM